MRQVNNEIEVNLQRLKEKVAAYKKVMLEDFKIPTVAFFETIPFNITHIKNFLELNGPEVAGARMYFGKASEDKDVDDYDLILVPCKEVKENNKSFYEDIFKTKYKESLLLSLT